MKWVKGIGLTFLAVIVLSYGSYMVFFKPDPLVFPEARPLGAGLDLSSVYGIEAGLYTPQKISSLKVDGLNVSVYFPKEEGRFPLLVFSHGNFSDRHSYDRVIMHWVSHGYVVLSPDHLDAGGMVNGISAMLRYGQDGVLKQRPQDLILLLDNLETIEEKLPALKGKVNADLVAATGHSFGAFAAQMMGGADAADPTGGERLTAYDARIKAIVALSPPGPMFDMIDQQSWDSMKKPQLVTTGTWDMDASFFREWTLHTLSYRNAPEGENYLLVTEGADHYLGNLICRLDRNEAPQQDALKMVRATTTAFLDAYLKQKPAAKAFIDSEKLQQVTADFSRVTKR
ncbi:hypothetical protein QGN29_03865 [Temperatibacter marinus]|uniref:Alpha/beta hydrolase family protein n=1 Tax=Temperatibacter marinus TaxID=1456591 RepID=A0AA52EH07_9PROT|nr:hypothetical protein [Temperatibacter marinus]WND03508.1 hypothetical protein QGN29_03865 [Temperatibacter marinus]